MMINLSNRQSFIIVALIVFTGAFFNIIHLNEEHDYGDYSLYIMQAKSLVDGGDLQLLELNKYALDHSERPRGPYLYPWGLPVLLSPVIALFGENLLAFKMVLVLCLAVTCFMIYVLFRHKLGNIQSILIVALFSFNTFFLFYTNYVMADLPFFAASLVTLYLIQKALRSGEFPGGMLAVMIGFFMFFSFLLRTNGIIFLPLLFVCQLVMWYKQRLPKVTLLILTRNLVPYLVFSVFMVLSTLYFPEVTGENTHMGRLSMVSAESIYNNLLHYLSIPAEFFPSSYGFILYYAGLPFVLWGMFRTWKDDYLYLLFIVMNLGVFIIWPYTQGLRFLFPLLPFYFYYLFTGFSLFQERLLRLPSNLLVYGYAGALSALFLLAQAKRLTAKEEVTLHGAYSEIGREMMDFIKTNTTQEDIIIFGRPRAMVYHTGRRSILDERPDVVKQMHGYYLVIDKVLLKDQIGEEAIDETFIPVFSNAEYDIYRIDTLSTRQN